MEKATRVKKIQAVEKKRRVNTSQEVTILDVAREAGVSNTTVSRVLNNKGYIKPETHKRVMDVMERLGYRVNEQARSLASGKHHAQVIGLLVSDLSNSYIGEVIKGIETTLLKAQYNLLLYTTGHLKAQESPFASTLTRGLADGLIAVHPKDADALIDMLRQRHFPHVLINDQFKNTSSPIVRVKNWSGSYHATRYLIELGHRRIGFIAGDPDLETTTQRSEGYLAALQDHQLPIDPSLMQSGLYAYDAGYRCAQQLLALPAPPTALLAANDAAAFGAMDAIRERWLRIPEDISIIGFDDVPQAAHVRPPLTTVRQPMHEMGRLAASMLLEYIEEPELPVRHVELATELIIRASCSPPEAIKQEQ